MDPLSVILGIASTVVGNVLSELITGKTKAARRAEIERAVAIALAEQQRALGTQAAALRQQTLDEVSLLVERSPDLAFRGDDVVLTYPLRARAIRGKSYVNAELHKTLENLQQIVATRRKQLGLPTTAEDADQTPVEWVPVTDEPPDRALPRSEDADDHTNSWVQVNSDPAPGPWSAELLRMQDRIRRRRAGLDVSDGE
jgi:hypothetical protein